MTTPVTKPEIMKPPVNEPEIMTLLFQTKDSVAFGKQDGTVYHIQKFQPVQIEPNVIEYEHIQTSYDGLIGPWPEILPDREKITLEVFGDGGEKHYAIGFLKHTQQWVISELTK